MLWEKAPQSFWEEVYDVLMEKAGATDGTARGCFLASTPPTEFRFCGSLGFGGKVRTEGTRLFVTCYPEDITPEREVIMADTNAALERLVTTYRSREVVPFSELDEVE